MNLYIDLSKAILDTAKLVKKQVQVRGKNGKIFNRMQWVDPHSDQPVMEEHHDPQDEHHKQVMSMDDKQKHQAALRYLTTNKEHAHKFAMATGMRRDPAHLPASSVAKHIAENLHKVPHSHIQHHLEEPKPSLPDNGVNHAQMSSVQSGEANVSEKEAAERTGKIGPLDLSKLQGGTSVADDKEAGYMFSKEDKAVYNSLFKGASKKALEHVFSHPDGEFNATLSHIEAYDMGKGIRGIEINMDLHDKGGEYMGMLVRQVGRDKKGVIHVTNHEMSIKKAYQGNGASEHIYHRSEQYWKHLSDGNPVHVHLQANISVGVYAWAKKGFDFASKDELVMAKDDLTRFCKKNSIDLNEVLKKSGHKNINSLKHSWDFANLTDGRTYDLQSVAKTRYKNEIKGEGNFGKAFMLGGKDAWYGVKKLNEGDKSEKVSKTTKRVGA